jgi:hypothetical protein
MIQLDHLLNDLAQLLKHFKLVIAMASAVEKAR